MTASGPVAGPGTTLLTLLLPLGLGPSAARLAWASRTPATSLEAAAVRWIGSSARHTLIPAELVFGCQLFPSSKDGVESIEGQAGLLAFCRDYLLAAGGCRPQDVLEVAIREVADVGAVVAAYLTSSATRPDGKKTYFSLLLRFLN